jgi:uncharacterized membrane protein (UPF0127 family)
MPKKRSGGRYLAIENLTRGGFLGTQIEVADSFTTRLVGLLGRRELPPGGGLLIRPSSGVHTFAMRFPIDVVTLDRRQRILSLHPNLRPWRISRLDLRIRSVLELPSGTIAQTGLRVGDQLCTSFPAGVASHRASAAFYPCP